MTLSNGTVVRRDGARPPSAPRATCSTLESHGPPRWARRRPVRAEGARDGRGASSPTVIVAEQLEIEVDDCEVGGSRGCRRLRLLRRLPARSPHIEEPMNPYSFLVDTYATERIKTLSVW